jgi:hypothetical protein
MWFMKNKATTMSEVMSTMLVMAVSLILEEDHE